MKKINFSAGPSILPKEVTEQMAQAIIDYNNSGLSLLEISHRSPAFDDIIEESIALVTELYQLPDEYEVLFLTGGASTQFCLVPYNLLSKQSTAAYLDTGNWSKKAIKEAQIFGNTQIVASSASTNYNHVPKNYALSKDFAYLHLTTNNTVFGAQIHEIPDAPCPIVADMSSDIFSKPLNINDFGLIYAGAQKNTGPAGVTLVIVRKDLLGKVQRAIPTMLDYRTHIKKRIFNTPPVYAIYGCMLTLRWAKARGLAQIYADNQAKANLLYSEIDRNSLFRASIQAGDRSLMNVTFICPQRELEPHFLSMAEQAGCVALKGYRTVGGFRASIYNAFPIAGVQTLVSLMQEFERRFG